MSNTTEKAGTGDTGAPQPEKTKRHNVALVGEAKRHDVVLPDTGFGGAEFGAATFGAECGGAEAGAAQCGNAGGRDAEAGAAQCGNAGGRDAEA